MQKPNDTDSVVPKPSDDPTADESKITDELQENNDNEKNKKDDDKANTIEDDTNKKDDDSIQEDNA